MSNTEVLSAPLMIEYPFSRTVGPVQSAFFTGLREGIVVGVKRPDGTVLVPPTEYDPETSEELTELVEVGQAGVVTSWAWVAEGRPKVPLEGRPFAWALIQLDGADTSMIHAVDVATEADMSTGMRVEIKWSEQREGAVTDIACFVPEENS